MFQAWHYCVEWSRQPSSSQDRIMTCSRIAGCGQRGAYSYSKWRHWSREQARTTKTPGDKHRKLPRDDREGYAKSKGCVIVASSYAKSQQNK